ncbi:MAG: iron ABC transporter permease [Betaproteobacteria bacterium]|nr:iron ABC transporter permease [Betaproteobacteria bacterium]
MLQLGTALFSLCLAAEACLRLGWWRGERFALYLLLACAALVLVFVFFPVSTLLVSAVLDEHGTLAAAEFWRRLSAERTWSLACLAGRGACGAAWNTLSLALLTASGTTLLGLVFALLVTRAKLPGRRALRLLTVLPIITPPFVIGLALILLFGRSGAVNAMLESAFGITPTRWIYGLPGVVLAQLLAYTPVAFLVLIGVVEGVSPTLEEASRTLHASERQTFARVSLPLMTPGIANAFLVGFIESIADFGNPLLLGANFNVLATEIYFAIVGAQYDQGKAAALAIVLLAIALAAFALQRLVVGRGSFVTLTGKGDAGVPRAMVRGARVTCLAIALPWTALTVAVYAMALFGGFVEIWGRDHSFTLRHYAKAFSLEWTVNGLLWSGAAWSSFWNTLAFAAVAAPLSAAIGLACAWLIERGRFAGRRVFEFLTLVSFAVPGTVLGIAYVLAFNTPPIELTGTAAIIVLSFVFRNLPVGVRGGVAALAQIDRSLEEASLTLGARVATGLRRVLLPLLRPALVAALVYGFVRSVTTVSAIIFLVSGETEVATTYIIGRAVNGDYGVASAYSAVLILMMVLAVLLIQWLVGERRLGRRAMVITGGAG